MIAGTVQPKPSTIDVYKRQVVGSAGLLLCSHILSQIGDDITLGLEFTGIEEMCIRDSRRPGHRGAPDG